MAMLWGSAKRMLQALIRGTRRRRKRAPQLAPPAAVRVRPASAPDPPPPHLRLRYCLHRAMEVRAEQRARDAAGTRPRPAAG
jgi:hypothetical protein